MKYSMSGSSDEHYQYHYQTDLSVLLSDFICGGEPGGKRNGYNLEEGYSQDRSDLAYTHVLASQVIFHKGEFFTVH